VCLFFEIFECLKLKASPCIQNNDKNKMMIFITYTKSVTTLPLPLSNKKKYNIVTNSVTSNECYFLILYTCLLLIFVSHVLLWKLILLPDTIFRYNIHKNVERTFFLFCFFFIYKSINSLTSWIVSFSLSAEMHSEEFPRALKF